MMPSIASDSFELFDWLFTIVSSVLATVIYAYILMRQAQQRAKADIAIFGFKLERAMCACEDDRPVVYANILKMMEMETGSGDSVTRLASFENLIREKAASALQSSFGRCGIPYSSCVAINLPMTLIAFDIAVAAFSPTPTGVEVNIRNLVDSLGNGIFGTFIWGPLTLSATNIFALWAARRFGKCKYLLTMFVHYLINGFLTWTLAAIYTFVGIDNSVGLGIDLSMQVAGIICVWTVFRPHRKRIVAIDQQSPSLGLSD